MAFLDNLKGLGKSNKLDEQSLAILEIENKKRTIQQAALNEINALKAKVAEQYRSIGENTYQMFLDDNFDMEKNIEMINAAKDLNKTVGEKQAKLDEIMARYDEELQILRPVSAVDASALAEGKAFCENCGASYDPGSNAFCENCGAKL